MARRDVGVSAGDHTITRIPALNAQDSAVAALVVSKFTPTEHEATA